ncbi:MAG: hypothetical protein JXL85_09200 [Bacilli bacterium]|nr:hypothetical protein [Bacilli bacterium]
MSNTSIGKGKKGSKFWIQEFINTEKCTQLNEEIKRIFKHIKTVTWVSPLKADNYKEIKPKTLKILKNADFKFWPNNGPWWDAIGIANGDEVVLVEAKGHIQELKSKCTATSHQSIMLIKKSMKIAHDNLGQNLFNEDLWLTKYYQYANRLSWYYHLKRQGKKVILLFIDFVNDYTHISTGLEKWRTNNEALDYLMFGKLNEDEQIKHIYLDVQKYTNLS